MTLQQDWQNEENANVVTSIFGYNENENLRHSAIPWEFDEWFHGDFKVNRPGDLSSALGSKPLEEYAESFPDYRINSVVEIGFDADGQTISDYEVQTTDPNDSSTSGGLSPVTLEGGSDEPANPFRNEYNYDGSKNYLDATVKGPHSKYQKVGPIDGIEGIRGSIILGGSDPYLEKAKKDIESLAGLTSGNVPAVISQFFSHVTTFYSFLDFVFMADGTKLVRVWDASVYPAHALYVGGTKQDQNTFREGIEWTVDGPVLENHAFAQFGIEGNSVGLTPFDQFGSFLYQVNFTDGFGPHPVMIHTTDGASLQASTVENTLEGPLFPDLGIY